MNALEPSKQKRALAPVRDSIPALTPKTCATAEASGKKRHFYKPLPIRFRRDGFNYCQLAREGAVAIYQQVWSGCTEPTSCYEVIRIRRREGFQIGGRCAHSTRGREPKPKGTDNVQR
jgi:hypothetical protein